MHDEGFTLGKYRIHREIGRGGMGVVYLAEDSNLLRKVALKTLRPSLGSDGKHLERFKREGQAVASLYHPNIVHINALEIIDAQLLIEMPYFSRGSVRDLLDAPPHPNSVTRILRDVLMALECCHGAGIIHRDVKPNNLLIDDAGKILLTDFGIASLLDAEWEATLSGNTNSLCFAGTPLYMSPGAWEGAAPSPHHDLYALGIIAREAATGTPPFSAPTPLAMMREILENELPPVCKSAPTLSPQLGALIDDLTCRTGPATKITSTEALHRLQNTPEFQGFDIDQDITQGLPRAQRRKIRAATTRQRRPVGRKWATFVGPLMLAGLAAAFGYLGHDRIAPQASLPQAQEATSVGLRQLDLITDSIPTVTDLLQSTLSPEVGRHRVVTAASSVDSGQPFSLLLRAPSPTEPTKILACKGDAIWGFDLRLQSPEHYILTGTWAQYATGDGEAFRWATLTGTAQWKGDMRSPLWINLEGVSQSDVAQWSEVWVVDTANSVATDTAFLRDFEAQPFSLALIYNELPARIQAETWNFKTMTPSLFKGRLQVERLAPQESIAVDGILDELPWARVLKNGASGMPIREGSRLQALFTPESLFLALRLLVPEDFLWEIELYVVERFSAPLSDTVVTHAYWDSSAHRLEQIQDGISTPISSLWQLQAHQAEETFSAEIRLPFQHVTTGETGTSPTPRLNLALYNRIGPDSRIAVAQWGWPDLAAVAHGLELQLNPSEVNGSPP